MELTQEQQELLKENLEKLPDICYGVLPIEPKIILLKAGERGYYESHTPTFKSRAKAEDYCNYLNSQIGVTFNQRKAMEHGSLWGFDTPAANPDNKINQDNTNR